MGKLIIKASVCQGYFQVSSILDMSQQGKGFKQRYYRNINSLSPRTPVLLTGNDQSEHVATGKIVQTTILSVP